MKKHILCMLCILCTLVCFLCGCSTSNSQATIDVLEKCKVIGSTITETSISADKEYFTITFENGLFYCEDRTAGGAHVVYTIKIPANGEYDMFSIISSIAPQITEGDFNELEQNNKVTFERRYKEHWRCDKVVEGKTVKYVIE